MKSFLYAQVLCISGVPRLAEPLRERIRERTLQVCEVAGVRIEHVDKGHIRKEDRSPARWLRGRRMNATGKV